MRPASVFDESLELLELAQSEPRAALARGLSHLRNVPTDHHAARSVAYRALGIAARLASHMGDALEYGNRAVSEAERAGNRTLRSEALLSLAGSMAFSGDNPAALVLLDEASEGAQGVTLAEIEFQRGTILGRMGESRRALAAYSIALPVLEQAGHRRLLAMTLHNRAMVELARGLVDDAERDFTRALQIDREDGRPIGVAGIRHGLGLIAALRGDLPLALRHLEESTRLFKDLLESAAESQVSQCEVLLSAGLFHEAFALAGEIAMEMHRAGLAEDEAEARLVGSQAALLGGKLDDAILWAQRAKQMFTDQDRGNWARIAHLIGLQARYQGGEAHRGLVHEADQVAEDLEEGGQTLAATRAWFLAGSIALRLGMADVATEDLTRVAATKSGPVELRLQAKLAQAMLKAFAGDSAGAYASARSGLALLDEYQSALGATDIRMGVERHGRELAMLGLKLALASGRPRRVFDWMERSRSRALVYRPAAPPRDEDMSADFAALRQVSSDLRTAEGDALAALMKRQRRLQESIRSRARLTTGQHGVARRVGPGQVASELPRGTLIEFASVEGSVWAVSVVDGRYRLREVGPEPEILGELESLRFMMRRMARGRGSLNTALEVGRRLDRLLFDSMRRGDDPLVLVATPELHVTPWAALPFCRHRPVTVSPSAELWYRARQRPGPGTGALLVAGPDLVMSDAEVGEIARSYPRAKLFSSVTSEVATVQEQLDGSAIAHIASHAAFQFENPMFSSLRLADGDLYVYDIERLSTAPCVVVLSACDSGFSEARAGEELMGLSSALLSMGTRSIIASVGLVPDSEPTKDLMVELHRRLVAGLPPAVALHQAQQRVADTPEGYVAAASFVCIGAG